MLFSIDQELSTIQRMRHSMDQENIRVMLDLAQIAKGYKLSGPDRGHEETSPTAGYPITVQKGVPHLTSMVRSLGQEPALGLFAQPPSTMGAWSMTGTGTILLVLGL